MTIHCENCPALEATEYTYPDGTKTNLCDECARGLFCLGCGSFTGGTEEIFIHGAYQCDACAGDEEGEFYEDEYGDW